MYCNKCGAEIPDGSIFCNECGANTATLKKRSSDTFVVKPKKRKQAKATPKKDIGASGCLTRALGMVLVLIIVVGIAYLLFHPQWRELYIYEKTAVTSNSLFVDSESDYANWSEDFCNSYLIKNDRGYSILDYEKDRSLSARDMKSSLAGTASVTFSSNGSYAHIEIKAIDFDETINITFRSVNLKERLEFLRMFFLTLTNN